MSGPSDTLRLLAEVEKLCRHVAGLQRDVQALGQRLVPLADGERPRFDAPPAPWESDAFIRLKPDKATMADLSRVVSQADCQLQSAELDIGYIRSKVDEAMGGDNAVEWRWAAVLKDDGGG